MAYKKLIYRELSTLGPCQGEAGIWSIIWMSKMTLMARGQVQCPQGLTTIYRRLDLSTEISEKVYAGIKRSLSGGMLIAVRVKNHAKCELKTNWFKSFAYKPTSWLICRRQCSRLSFCLQGMSFGDNDMAEYGGYVVGEAGQLQLNTISKDKH